MNSTNAKHATGIAMPILKMKKTMLLFVFSFCIIWISSAKNNQKSNLNKQLKTLIICNQHLSKGNTNTAEIYGTVVDKNNTALQNVDIIFDGKFAAITDINGAFRFNITKEIGKIYQIIFSKEGYNKAIRNYNFEMQEANYAIKMIVPCKCDTIICKKCFLNNIAFDFDNESSKLNEVQKKLLDGLIECLKLNPEKNITIQYNTIYPKKQIGPQRLAAVLHYFMLKGIMDNRIQKETVTNKDVSSKQIEILNQ